MTAVYEKSGVSFQYPANWTLSDEETKDWPRMVTLNSPTGAFWSLTIYPHTADPEEILDSIIETMRQDYQNLETETTHEKIGHIEAFGIDIDFVCLDMVVDSHLRAFDMNGLRFVIFYQGEDHDFRKLLPVFQAMSFDLVNNAKKD